MKKRKKLFSFGLVLLLVLSSFSYVYADNEYQVADVSSGELEIIETFDNRNTASSFYKDNLDNYDNLVIIKEDKIIKMEYGIVEILNDGDSCELNTDYTSTTYGSAYTNGCYARDAAYINTSNNYLYVTFKMAGDIGIVDINEVKLIPYEMIDVRTSKYSTSNNTLHHDIKNDLNNDYYAYSISLDIKPDYLENDESYYSYDGHYFYNDFRFMIDDYRNDVYDNAINSDEPYYNYYEYLPHRSYTNYNLADVEDYFTSKLFIDGKIQFYDDLNLDSANDDVNLSQFYGELASFFGYEKLYGANAMMMLALSTHESAYGKSFLAFTKNNLFGHAAYDSDTERNASRYNSIDTSVYSHAKYYISRSYAGIHSSLYYGSYFGDKLSGMNVKYSSDPYWGEKAASNYFKFDEALGFKDRNTYALGIIENKSQINVYNDEELKSLAYRVNNTNNYAFIILEELDDVYKIQVDASYDSEYLYNPLNSIGYISKNNVDYIVNEDKISEREYKTVHFDFDGGELISQDEIDLIVLKDNVPSISEPKKEGYEFIGYDKELNNEDTDYKALYKKINNIEVSQGFNDTIEYNYFYNLKGGKIKVHYDDGTSKELAINTNMIESYDPETEGDSSLTINYCGVKVEYPVNFSKDLNSIRENLTNYIDKNIDSYKHDGTYDLDELNYIKDNLRKVDYLTSFDDIRYIDKMLLETTRDMVNYHFKDSKYDVSISGLALSLKNPKETNIFKPFKDTYYVETSELSNSSYERLANIAKAYGFKVEDGLKVSVKYNLEKANFDNPIVIQVKIQDKEKDKIYSVYHLDDDNNVIKCMTTQSLNYVAFMTRSEGDFLILSRDSVNTYDIEDRYENMSIHNSDPDNHLLFIEGGILAIFSLLGFIMIIVYVILNKKKEKLWNDYKKSLLEAESLHGEKQKN